MGRELVAWKKAWLPMKVEEELHVDGELWSNGPEKSETEKDGRAIAWTPMMAEYSLMVPWSVTRLLIARSSESRALRSNRSLLLVERDGAPGVPLPYSWFIMALMVWGVKLPSSSGYV